MIKCVFSFTFSDSLLVLNQLTIFVMFVCIIFTSSSGFLPDTNMLESSAKRSENKTLDTLARSLMYNKNKRGQSMEPCVTPHDIVL